MKNLYFLTNIKFEALIEQNKFNWLGTKYLRLICTTYTILKSGWRSDKEDLPTLPRAVELQEKQKYYDTGFFLKYYGTFYGNFWSVLIVFNVSFVCGFILFNKML